MCIRDRIKTKAAGYEKAWSDAISAGGYVGAAALTELRAQTGVKF